jgi:sulfite exporter TauE/SafE/copper chaperone CopZ
MAATSLRIDGMYCDNCARTVERALSQVAGVASVTVEGHVAHIDHDGSLSAAPGLERAVEAVIDAGYFTSPAHRVDEERSGRLSAAARSRIANIVRFAALVGAVAAVGAVINTLAGYNIFNAIPTIDQSISLPLLFVTGLLTSIHCLSMCGAVNLAATQTAAPRDMRAPLAYNLGRLISYTALGALAGALGGVVSLTNTAQIVLISLAAAAMIALSLRMAGIVSLPALNLPVLDRLRAAGTRRARPRGAFAVGLANGAMPCGPLQAMQLYALSTGSPALGALSMCLFCLGTMPLMTAFAYAARWLRGRGRAIVANLAGAFMFVLALSMLARGLSIAGVNVGQVAAPTGDAAFVQATQADGYQQVSFDLTFDSYADFQVEADQPVRLVVHVDPVYLTGCNNEILMPEWGIDKKLEPGDNVIEFTPTQAGDFPYSCWMHMIGNTVRVTDAR